MNEQDNEHLRLLSIFHFVVAGIIAVFSLFPIFHIVFGLAMVTGLFETPNQAGPMPEIFGWIFIIFPAMMMLCGMAFSICVVFAGRNLGRRSGYVYCLAIAGILCMFAPVGTILGVLTIIVLIRPTVKEAFGVPATVTG